MAEIVKRCKKLAFYGVPGGDGTVTYKRMKGFDEITTSKNPMEYSRQYVDEEFEQTEVVGYATSIAFAFDLFTDYAVHADIASIFDDEKTGEDAVRSIIMVDISKEGGLAVKREFSVIAESEGDGKEAYKYKGSFRAKGEKVIGTASSADGWQTVTFEEAN